MAEQCQAGVGWLARGCSGSIVSSQGLVMTNHHCANSCVQQLSTATDDRIAKGFYAKRPEDEITENEFR